VPFALRAIHGRISKRIGGALINIETQMLNGSTAARGRFNYFRSPC